MEWSINLMKLYHNAMKPEINYKKKKKKKHRLANSPNTSRS